MHRLQALHVTGELLKWKVIVRCRCLIQTMFAGIPFTVKSLAWTVPDSPGRSG